VGRKSRFSLKALSLALLLLVILSGLSWTGAYAWQRHAEGSVYLEAMRPASAKLKPLCDHLSQASERLLITSGPPLSSEETDTRISELRSKANDVRSELKRFDAVASSYQPSPYLPVIDSQKAQTLHTRAVAASAQVREVLDDYDGLLTFLERYYKTNAQFSAQLARFNGLTDLNVLQGTTFTILSTSGDIESQIAELKTMSPPPNLEVVRAQAIATHEKAASGFRALANALSPPIDGLIYAAAGEIESATSENEATSALLDTKLQASPILKDVSELSEKISDFTF